MAASYQFGEVRSLGLSKPLDLCSRSFSNPFLIPFMKLLSMTFCHSVTYLSYCRPSSCLFWEGLSTLSPLAAFCLQSLKQSCRDLTLWPWLLAYVYFCKQKAIYFHHSKTAVWQKFEVHTASKKGGLLPPPCAISMTIQRARWGNCSGWKLTN